MHDPRRGTDSVARRAAYEAQAWRDVGLDRATVARMHAEHGRLHAGLPGRPAQAAADVLDLAERRRLMKEIAAAYGRMYQSAPQCFVWMGFAAVAVIDGVLPTTELALAASRSCRLAGRMGRWLLSTLGGLLAGARHEAVEDAIKAAFEANFAIFADLYWVHLAHRAGGIEELRSLGRAGLVAPAVLDGFEQIDAGGRDVDARAGHEQVTRGNLRLLEHEQRSSVTPVFAKYRGALALCSRLGLVAVPNPRIRESCRAMGRSPRWADSHPRDSYGPFDPRWGWLEQCAWQPLVRLHEDTATSGGRTQLGEEVARAVRGQPARLAIAISALRRGRKESHGSGDHRAARWPGRLASRRGSSAAVAAGR